MKTIIIGSGVAAATVARGLLDRGAAASVIMLEAGNEVKLQHLRHWHDFVTTGTLPYVSNRDQEGEFECTAEGVGLVESRLFAKGGSTVHWGGWALRFKPEDFRLKSASGREIDWPFGYEDLESYYHQAEQRLGIAGDSGQTDPPRKSGDYPYTAPPYCMADGPIIEAMDRLALDYGHLPIARFGNRCMTTGTCKYCPLGGRYAAPMDLDRLLADYGPSGRFRLLLGAAARRIIMQSAKRAAGVEYAKDGEIRVGEADEVIVCAGALETPKLLLLSTSPFWPNGLGNAAGHVGRHFKTHPMIYSDASFPANAGGMHQEIDFPTLCSRHFDSPAYQAEGKMFFVRAVSSPNAGIERLMKNGRTAAEIKGAVTGPMTLTLNGFIEQFSSFENRVSTAAGTNRFGLPRTAVHFVGDPKQASAVEGHVRRLCGILEQAGGRVAKSGVREPRADHTTSTTRMSKSDGEGVVDENLRVHGTDNVFVVSNAVIPNVTAVNPTLTLVALALRFVSSRAPGRNVAAAKASRLQHSDQPSDIPLNRRP